MIALEEQSDEELYRRMQTGDQQAFATLYQRREPALYRYAAHASGDPYIAEEATQEAFLRLAAPNARFDEKRGTVEAYLYGIARNFIRVTRRGRSFGEPKDQPTHSDML